VSYVDPTAASGASAATAGTQSSTGLNQLDNSQTFLQLLVAQLQNQDPDNPTDPTSFMTEIAQLTAVQSQTSLNAEEQTVAADSMLDRTVTGSSTNGQSVTGTVTGVLLSSSGPPTLSVTTASGQSDVLALDAISQVSSSAPTSTTSTSPSGGTTTSAG
jgi:flagellar basal-body rod modification protein FlgD